MLRSELIKYLLSFVKVLYALTPSYIDCFFYSLKGTWPLDSRHRSVRHTESGIGEAAGHREPATRDRGAAASQRDDGGGHE